MEGSLPLALALTLFAGLSTGLGSFVVFFSRAPSFRLLSFGLGFSAGVMIYISLVELLPQSSVVIAKQLGEAAGGWVALACFFGGIGASALIDALVPEPANPHEAVPLRDIVRAGGNAPVPAPTDPARARAVARVGMFTALAVGLHNLPEGIATFVSAMSDWSLGVSIAIAVAVHNIPEGISVAVPVYFATGSRRKAVVQAFLSGLAEPAGALAAWLILMPFLSDALVGASLAAAAGVMVFISFDELLPTAREYGHGHTEILGIVLGMAVMAVSLQLL